MAESGGTVSDFKEEVVLVVALIGWVVALCSIVFFCWG